MISYFIDHILAIMSFVMFVTGWWARSAFLVLYKEIENFTINEIKKLESVSGETKNQIVKELTEKFKL